MKSEIIGIFRVSVGMLVNTSVSSSGTYRIFRISVKQRISCPTPLSLQVILLDINSFYRPGFLVEENEYRVILTAEDGCYVPGISSPKIR